MYPALIEKDKKVQKKLNLKNDLFCKVFATDPNCIGNASYAYAKVYGVNIINARVASTKLMDKPEITARINEYLSAEGFNDVSIDKKHNFLVHQNKDFNVSLKAIQEYNKLKKRVNSQIEVILPRPLLELDDDEVIHKIDKSKAIDISNTELPNQVE